MRIRELTLTAYGPFAGKRLGFETEGCGLHLVYGPNEAGKSSTLRALKALLFGIEERTADNFRHENKKLRIEGRLLGGGGKELHFMRRKGRKNTLQAPDGTPLGNDVLAPFMEGVSAELFEMLFGIDHHALQRGGQEILEQKGEVGQALFSASMGSQALHGVLQQLDAEAESLFKPRGSNQAVNAAVREYQDIQKQIKELSLPSRQYDEQRRALERTGAEIAELEHEKAGISAELNRLRRFRQILPRLARRRECHEQLQEMGDVVLLPEDFGQRRQQSVAELDKAQALLDRAEARRAELREKHEALSIDAELLARESDIEDLYGRLGGQRKAREQRPVVATEHKQLVAEVRSLLKEFRPDLEPEDVEELRPLLARRPHIQRIGGQYGDIEARLKAAGQRLDELCEQLDTNERRLRQLPPPLSPQTLSAEVAAARRVGDMDRAIRNLRLECDELQEACANELARLGLWQGPLDALVNLPLPDTESIARFEDAFARQENRLRQLDEQREAHRDEMRQASRELEELLDAGQVPEESELYALRSVRDEAWQLLRRQWLDGEDVAQAAAALGDEPLPELFEQRVRGADELADRLRREADRVHARAALQARHEAARDSEARLTDAIEAGRRELDVLERQWRELWRESGVAPRTPREMRGWLERALRLRGRVDELTDKRRELARLDEERGARLDGLNRQLRELGREAARDRSLEQTLQSAEEALEAIVQTQRQRQELETQAEELAAKRARTEAELADVRAQLAHWREQWRQALAGSGLPEGVSPSEASEALDRLRALFDKRQAAEKLQYELQSLDQETEDFQRQATHRIQALAPQLAGLSAEEAVQGLHVLMRDNRQRHTRKQQLDEQLEKVEGEITEARGTIKTMRDRLAALCAEAGVEAPEALQQAEHAAARRRELEREIARLEQEMAEAGEGATLDALQAEAEEIDPDALPVRLESLEQREAELQPRLTELGKMWGSQRTALDQMDGSDRAAALAEQGQALLASIRAHGERFVRLKLASRILRDQIERYRQENQGPLVRRASDYFGILTRGSFEGLRADVDERDEPVLMGVRPDGERVSVEGMSAGTRDQLYLALRLASLEKYLDSGTEPMPFIVDDILVDFDDQRAAAALEALAALGERTQVIVFTHHARLVEQARALSGTRVQVLELEDADPIPESEPA